MLFTHSLSRSIGKYKFILRFEIVLVVFLSNGMIVGLFKMEEIYLILLEFASLKLLRPLKDKST